jgi:TPR repeat protein
MRPGWVFLAAALALPTGVAAAPSAALRTAAEAGDARAQFTLAIMYDTADGVPYDFPQAVLWFTRSAEGGYAVAQAKLGLMYRFGWAVPRDPAQAAAWDRKAAEQGLPIAQFHIAELTARGAGVEPDLVRAHMWAALAARHDVQGAADLRDRVAERMSATEIAAAEKLAARWRPRPR